MARARCWPSAMHGWRCTAGVAELAWHSWRGTASDARLAMHGWRGTASDARLAMHGWRGTAGDARLAMHGWRGTAGDARLAWHGWRCNCAYTRFARDRNTAPKNAEGRRRLQAIPPSGQSRLQANAAFRPSPPSGLLMEPYARPDPVFVLVVLDAGHLAFRNADEVIDDLWGRGTGAPHEHHADFDFGGTRGRL